MLVYIRVFLSILILFALSNCVSTVPLLSPPFNQKLTWDARKTQLQTIHTFETQGMLSIQTPSQNLSASFCWQQHAENYRLRLFGPMGMGMILIHGNGSATVVKTSDKAFENQDPKFLFQQKLGFTPPIAELFYWLRSLPSPTMPAKLLFDPYHHLAQLSQNHWKINYLSYAGVKKFDLPNQITAVTPDIKIKLFIQRWKI
jgi:outer membrane lipoprotein LolB